MKKAAPHRESRETYRQKLIEKRHDFMAGAGTRFDTFAQMGRVAEDDQAQLSHDEFISLHLNSMDFAQLRLVEEALDRLDAGDYGTCLSCEQPIPDKRLAAVPWARYCVACQENMAGELGTGLAGDDAVRMRG